MLKFVRKLVQKVQGHPAMAKDGDGELELLFPNLRGGYVHHNLEANTSLNAYLTGTTTDRLKQ